MRQVEVDMNRAAQIKSIAEDSRLSINGRVEAILSVREEVDADTDEYYKLGCTVFETIRALLLGDNYEECRRDDLLMCDCLLVEAYWHTSRSWLIAPLAQELYAMLAGSLTTDPGKLSIYSQVLGRVCYCLRGTGHPRLMMKLLAIRLGYEKALPEPDPENLEDIAGDLYRLALLTDCNTWLGTVEADVVAILGAEKMKAIEKAPQMGHLKADPVEYTEQWENIIDKVEAEVGEELAGEPVCMGFCFKYWSVKERVLHKYGIDWRSPMLMNPGVTFD